MGLLLGYGRAIDFYSMYSDKLLEDGKTDERVSRYIKECNLAIETESRADRIEIENLGKEVNSSSDDYSPVLSKDEKLLYFTSRRGINENEALQKSDNKLNENIFLSSSVSDRWGDTGPAGREICTPLNEGVLYVDNKNESMLIYAGWSGEGDIMISNFELGEWTEPEKYLDELSTPYRETSVAITASGNEIFFTSDMRRNSFGGRDIYSIKRIKKNKWTRPANLGPLVNSEGNEEAVWTSHTGDTIWYSSNGLLGFGGYDIFMAVRDITGKFSEPVNLGQPVNSQWNDLFYRPSLVDRREAYMSSNRPDGLGGLDLYKVRRIPAHEIEQDTTNINLKPITFISNR